MQHTHVYIFLGVSLLLVSGLVGAFTSQIFFADVPTAATSTPPVIIEETQSTDAHFFSDRFVFFDDSGESPFILEVNASRQEKEQGQYLHYYSLDVLREGGVYNAYKDGMMDTENIQPLGFLASYTSHTPRDLSPREAFVFDIDLEKGKSAHIVIATTTAEFIIKNSLDYSKYYAVGTAIITIDDKIYATQVLHGRIYSEDYTKTVFFEEPDDFVVRSTQFMGWDEEGTFYLFDQSLTSVYEPAYTSHQWAIIKDAEGRTQKYYEFDLDRGADANYIMQVGENTVQLNLDNEHDMLEFYTDQIKGYANGNVAAEEEESISISGMFYSVHPVENQ